MTHQSQSSELIQAVKLLAENGFQGMANAIEILLNEAMKLEQTEYLGAQPYERSSQRRSHANGSLSSLLKVKTNSVLFERNKRMRVKCRAVSTPRADHDCGSLVDCMLEAGSR